MTTTGKGALALLVSVAFLWATVLAGTGWYEYVAMGSQSSVQFPEQASLILDCLPYANSTYGVEANLSTIRWFRRWLTTPMAPFREIVDNSTMHIFLSGNRERLLIQVLTIATGAQVGTEAAYGCEVCRNVPPEPRRCSQTTTNVRANSPPVLECVNPPPSIDTSYFFIIVDIDIGCDLCIEHGVTVDILTIMCIPDTSRPSDCVMTTPNGTNVLDINDPLGTDFTIQTAGGTVSAVSIYGARNPDRKPLGFDVLGTWTCQCNNSDGRSVAYSTLGSCLTTPVIDKGVFRPPPGTFPPYVGPGGRSFKIGSNDYLLEGQNFTISCAIIAGDPFPSVMWFRDGAPLPEFVNRSSITTDVPGEYNCTAKNGDGTDSAISRMRRGIEILRSPKIVKGQQRNVPTTIQDVEQVERIGTDVHVITGRMATIICQLRDASLPAVLQWTRNGRPLNESRYFRTSCRETLAISSVTDEDEATYCCSAENVAGIDSACSGLFVRKGGPTL